tara:strand:- start:686 stop:838 length:153 start_codon:yes stop_codon:yes gene_type:complete
MMQSIKLNDDDVNVIVDALKIAINEEQKSVYLIDQMSSLIDELKTQSENK